MRINESNMKLTISHEHEVIVYVIPAAAIVGIEPLTQQLQQA